MCQRSSIGVGPIASLEPVGQAFESPTCASSKRSCARISRSSGRRPDSGPSATNALTVISSSTACRSIRTRERSPPHRATTVSVTCSASGRCSIWSRRTHFFVPIVGVVRIVRIVCVVFMVCDVDVVLELHPPRSISRACRRIALLGPAAYSLPRTGEWIRVRSTGFAARNRGAEARWISRANSKIRNGSGASC